MTLQLQRWVTTVLFTQERPYVITAIVWRLSDNIHELRQMSRHLCRIRGILIAIVVFSSCTVQAATLGVHAGSAHFPGGSYQNNFNPGVYLRTDDGITVGGYYNTLRRLSLYAGYTFEYGPLGLLGGVVTGYQPKTIDGLSYGQGKALTPMLALSLQLPPLGGFKPMVMLVPAFRSSPAVLHLAFEHRF